MKVVFVSNYYNHHQSCLSEAMFKKTNGQYVFIATQPMEEERVKMGWSVSSYPSFVKFLYKDEQSKGEAQTMIDNADVVIFGSAPISLIKNRLMAKKLIFRYSERIYKEEPSKFKLLFHYLKFGWESLHSKNVYLLCASAFTSMDFNRVHAFKNKSFKWGYFPFCKKYDNWEAVLNNKTPKSLLWVARFIDWKHPEIPIQIVERLKQDGFDINLKMIGNGILLNKFKQIVIDKNLQDEIQILGALRPAEVRSYMERSEVFLFTSDKNEGWGAVLNEAMNSGCAVVASHAIGAVPYLIRDGINGIIYRDGDIDDMYSKTKSLLQDKNRREMLATNAYKTITENWNAEIAATRLLILIEALQNSQETPYENGLCSKAELICDDWKV